MHDPIGAFTRIRELYLSYLDTAFRIEDPAIAQERRELLRAAGKLCADPLLESQPQWQHDSRRNALRASVLIGLIVAAILFSILTSTIFAVIGVLVFYGLLMVRSAYKARWKDKHPVTLLLYGIHSQFQQIPIACGQLSYWYHRFRNKQQGLIEYK